ncbi:MAG: DUF177 domain-containing protein [bacterium]
MKINIQNLKDGNYSFEFKKNCHDLNLEECKIFKNDITIKCELEKRDKNIFVKTQVQAPVNYSCDKCLVEFTDNLGDNFRFLYTSDKQYIEYAKEDEESVQLIKPHTREIDLTAGVREALVLAIPMRVVCSENCKGLCPDCGVNLNEEACHCTHESIDPRWEGLKKLIN